jgi:hypothetical protein
MLWVSNPNTPEAVMPFRLEHISLEERLELGCTSLLFAGEYGLISGLARQYGTSRQFLYTLRDRSRTALEQALTPGQSGRPPLDQRLVVDQRTLERAVLVLNQIAHASVRATQACLAEILQVERSVGTIDAVLAEAGRRAQALQPVPVQPLQAVADEIFAGRRPVLEVVDQRSGLVAVLAPVAVCDETSWGCTWLDLHARGVGVASLAADGATGLQAGAHAAGLPPVRLDHWHTLRDLGRVQHLVEAAAYQQLTVADRAERAAAAAHYAAEHGHRPRRGRPLQAPTDPASVAAAGRAADAAVQWADAVTYLLTTVRAVLPPLDPSTGRVHESAEVVSELGAAAVLLRELGGLAVRAAILLEQRAVGLARYLDDLAATLAAPRAVLDTATVTCLGWAWQHRAALGLTDAAVAWPAAPDAARQVWAALDGALRGTGMVENLNSILAFARTAHRGLPVPVLALFAVYHNQHVFARGRRAGHSPLELAGLASPPWLDALGYPRSPARPEFLTPPAETVNTLIA